MRASRVGHSSGAAATGRCLGISSFPFLCPSIYPPTCHRNRALFLFLLLFWVPFSSDALVTFFFGLSPLPAVCYQIFFFLVCAFFCDSIHFELSLKLSNLEPFLSLPLLFVKFLLLRGEARQEPFPETFLRLSLRILLQNSPSPAAAAHSSIAPPPSRLLFPPTSCCKWIQP